MKWACFNEHIPLHKGSSRLHHLEHTCDNEALTTSWSVGIGEYNLLLSEIFTAPKKADQVSLSVDAPGE